MSGTFDEGGGNIFKTQGDFKFKDKFTDLMIGGKFIFFPNSTFKPFFTVLAGFSDIESKFTDPDKEVFDSFDLSSSGLSVNAEAGGEFFFNSHIALGATVGYQYLGMREFRIKAQDGKLSKDTFKTKMDYSNTYLSLGFKVYFN